MTERKQPLSTRVSKAVAVEWAFDVVGGYEVIKIMFELRGTSEGMRRSWTGFFTDSSLERTLQSIRHCGWVGETLGDMSGMGDAEVELVLATYKGNNGKNYEEAQWVNRPARLNLQNAMSADRLLAFSASMERLTRDSARSYGVQPAAARTAEPAKPAAGFADMPYDGPEGPPHTDADSDNLPF